MGLLYSGSSVYKLMALFILTVTPNGLFFSRILQQVLITWTMIQYQFQSMAQYQGMCSDIWLFYVKRRVTNALHHVLFPRHKGAKCKGFKPSVWKGRKKARRC